MSSHIEAARQCKLFSGLTDEELLAFMRFADFKAVPQFSEVCKVGEFSDFMFVLLTGDVRVRLMIAEKERILTTLPAGEFFGEISLFDPMPRSADIVANFDSTLLRLSSVQLSRMIEDAPDTASGFLSEVCGVFLSRIAADKPRFGSPDSEVEPWNLKTGGERRVPTTPEIDRLLTRMADSPVSNLKPELVDALASRRFYKDWGRADLEMLASFGEFAHRADQKTVQDWIARGDIQQVLAGTVCRGRRGLRRGAQSGWVGLQQWLTDSPRDAQCPVGPDCAYFRLTAEARERMKGPAPVLLAKLMRSFACYFTRRIRKDHRSLSDPFDSGSSWSPDENDDQDEY